MELVEDGGQVLLLVPGRDEDERAHPSEGILGALRRRLLLVAVAAALVAVPASSATVLPGFRSPSGNIRCLAAPGPPAYLWCSIGKADYVKKLTAYCAQPRIGVDWAGFTLGARSKGSVACSGGTMYDPATQHPHVDDARRTARRGTAARSRACRRASA